MKLTRRWLRRRIMRSMVAVVGLAACTSSEKSEAQPDGPVGLFRIDSVAEASVESVSPSVYDAVSRDTRGDTIVESVRASDYVHIRRGASAPDSFQFPRLRRRGAPGSTPIFTRFLDDTLVAVIHEDSAASRKNAQFFLSLLDLRSGRVCLDLPLRLSATRRPQFSMQADTLAALIGSAAAGAGGRVRWHVAAARCPWNHVAR